MNSHNKSDQQPDQDIIHSAENEIQIDIGYGTKLI